MEKKTQSLAYDLVQRRIGRRAFLKRALAAGMSMSAALTLLEACAPAATPTPAPPRPTTPAPTTAPTIAPTATPVPVPKKVTIALGATPNTTDPQLTSHGPTNTVLEHVFQRLIRPAYDLSGWEPDLATSWKALDDVTWEFSLREGVTFHNGEPFNAESVRFSIERIKVPEVKSVHQGRYQLFKEAEIVDDYTVRLHLSQMDPNVLAYLGGSGFMVPPGYMNNDPLSDILTREPVGTGPYKFVGWEKDKSLELEVSKDYRGPEPYFEQVSFVVIPDNTTRSAALVAGDVDIADNLALADRDMVNASGAAEAILQQITRVAYFVFVFRSALSLKLEFRRACNHAIDVDSIITNVLGGAARRVPSLLAPTTVGYDPTIPVYPYDADKARELLDEAGYAGEEVEMEGLRGRFMSDKEICEATAGFLEEAGLKVKLNIHEWSEYRKKRDDQRWGPIGVSSLGQSSRVGAHTLNMQATCTHHQWADQTTYCNEEVDKWVNEAISTYDEDKAARALREAQLLLYEDAAFIPLFTLKMVYGRSNKIKWQPAPIERIHAWTMGPA